MAAAGGRNVRRRQGPALALAQTPAPVTEAPTPGLAVSSPLVALLDLAVSAGKVVKDPRGEVYTGFASYSDLANSNCAFVPMNSNRAINRDVVHQRVQENIEAFDRTGRYMEFGQINLLIVAQDPSQDFFVMDGQHRCEVMQALHHRFRGRELWFQFRAKVVASEPAAFDELRHFQRAYPTDPRSFFRSRASARAATAVLTRLRAQHPGAFRDMVLADRWGRNGGDPPRPYLSDSLLFWLLQDTGLVGGAGDAGGEVTASAGEVLAALERKDRLLAALPREALGKSATERMREVAARAGCWLGFFREGLLQWRDVEEPPPAARGPSRPETAAAKGASQQLAECTVCLDGPPEAALLPCGHRCVCMACAAAVRAARPPQCPLCRHEVVHVCRIYLS